MSRGVRSGLPGLRCVAQRQFRRRRQRPRIAGPMAQAHQRAL